jgi:hypothetical protein
MTGNDYKKLGKFFMFVGGGDKGENNSNNSSGDDDDDDDDDDDEDNDDDTKKKFLLSTEAARLHLLGKVSVYIFLFNASNLFVQKNQRPFFYHEVFIRILVSLAKSSTRRPGPPIVHFDLIKWAGFLVGFYPYQIGSIELIFMPKNLTDCTSPPTAWRRSLSLHEARKNSNPEGNEELLRRRPKT